MGHDNNGGRVRAVCCDSVVCYEKDADCIGYTLIGSETRFYEAPSALAHKAGLHVI